MTLTQIHPKLPMRNKEITKDFYVNILGFQVFGGDYPDYLMLSKDKIQLHFFLFPDLPPLENYGQIYIRSNAIEELYAHFLEEKVPIHPNDPLRLKPWGIKEFSLLDPDHNLITFGEDV
ncbi:bleomycin resistance protein [Sphingobacterium humi]|uniref:Bleomycin resistance protein n=1 Tax=Sphingobacterium humi TaxID=1796905 RepID=A0A6N8L424_9SPHI|nr:VOC family protein [Sphingobacterium humi]MVZ64126.1 VOC family protein [Sphingobacterium humi]